LQKVPTVPGILVTKGMTLTIPAGTNFFSGAIAVQAHYDVCPTWLRLAVDHLCTARARRGDRVQAWQAEDQEKRIAALEREFESSMQAIVGAAIAIDSFYAVVKDKMGRPKPPTATNKKATAKKTRPSRSSQISETIKVAFGLKKREFDILRDNLAKIYNLRDLAVHPKGDAGDTFEPLELAVGVEWRLAFYRYDSAFGVVCFTIGLLNDLACNGSPKAETLKTYMRNLRQQTEPLWSKEIFSNAPPTGT
jgi:hypothetical protein